ncbi:MAG TPA: hypothetical protein VFV03_02420 [Solirubrobacteraceae bacterium]|nr:hypothetical protein [Solirubrobacteraceae bacterium]
MSDRTRGEHADPRQRPPDPAGTRPKFDPDTLRPAGDFLALPTGETASGGGSERLPEPVAGASSPALAGPRSQAPHTPRLQFLFGALGALGVAAVALAISLVLAPARAPGVPWSSWKPSGDVDPAAQIAAHVEPEYELSAGHRLVEVTGGPQAIGGQPVVVALRSSGSTPEPLPENGVFYQLRGEGPSGSIPGRPSVERGLLVRREALELALYTFRYVSGASQVIVTYPPLPPGTSSSAGKGSKKASETQAASGSATSTATTPTTVAGIGTPGAPSRVLLFRPSDVVEELSRPLDQTLSDVAPTVKTIAHASEAALLNELTGKLLYDSVLIPEQSASSVLLLQQPSIGG